ncbi:MAG: ParB/RepB/Spo0J family partition protein [Bacteroidota bacterium]
MAKKKPTGGLGRGLGDIGYDSLLSDNEKVELTSVGSIPLAQIESVNNFQPREDFNEEALDELADSIRIHGIIQPLTVRKLQEGKYQLIAGERRFRAAKIVGLAEVPVFIRTANDEEMLEIALIENIQREDLNPIEIANSYQRMIEEIGLRQEDLGRKVGKSRSSVTNFLSLLKLPPKVKKGVRDGEITFGHAKVIKGVDDVVQMLQIYDQVVENNYSVRQTTELVNGLKEKKSGSPAPKSDFAKPLSSEQIQLQKVERQLEEKFGNKVKIKQNNQGRGDISIAFNSTKDMNRILEILDL